MLPTSPRTQPPEGVLHPKRGQALINHINTDLVRAYDPALQLKRTFSRRHPLRAKPGAIVSVTSWSTAAKTGTSTFSGILLGVQRASVDTSFKLRNVVGRVGIEQSFKVCSPLIKEIKVMKNADGERKGGLRDLRRAKVNYLRDRPELLNQIAGAIKQQAALEKKRRLP